MKIEQHDAEKLAAGYSPWFRAFEVFSIVSFFSMTAGIVVRAAPHAQRSPWLVMAALMVGYLLADFTSGFVHWMGDTWGSTETPILGKALIRPFRQHHVDQKAITRHDYIETNGANCMIALPWALGSLLLPLDVPGWRDPALFAMTSIGSMIFWVMMTNQFHKWAHMEESEIPRLAGWAQRKHLILPPDHHQIHHTAPFETYYSITTGWLNWPFHKLGFYRHMERLVTALTGALPRRDDIGVEAALKTAPAPVVVAKSPDVQIDLSRT